MAKLDINTIYPYSEEYEYITKMVRLDLDLERKKDLSSDNGFVIGRPKGIKKDLKSDDSIFSSKFGQTLKDLNPFADRYKCDCGHLKSAINNGSVCPICGTKVKYVGDNLGYFGWIVLKGNNHYIIHPNLFKSIEAFIGKDRLDAILKYNDVKDADGQIVEKLEVPKKYPFDGIGMIQFRKRFDEIMDYYNKNYNNKSKKDYYTDIMNQKDKVFIQSIPVYTTLLRPIDVNAKNLYYESSNGYYNMINRLAWNLNDYENNKKKKIDNKKDNDTSNLGLLYDLQLKYNLLYKNIDSILQGKKGALRSLLAGRYNFSSRCVIVANPKMGIDQIILPYKCLVELLQQRIVNIIQKMYNKSYSDAYSIWYNANIKEDPMVKNIINTIINNSCDGKGLPIIINRNPTIAYGGILQMFCVGMNDSYTMEIPLQILEGLAA